jgi:chromosome segregation ATPase
MGEDEEYFDYDAVDVDPNQDPDLKRDPDDWAEIASFLDETRQQQLDRLRAKLGRIEQQIDDRYQVFEQTRSEIEDRIRKPAATLERLYGLPSTGPEQRKEELKEELSRLYSRLAETRRRCWQDIQQLEEQKRAVLEELDAVQDESLEEFL